MDNKRMPSVVEQVRGVSYKPTDLHASLDKDSITLLRANNIEDGKIVFSDVVFVDRRCVSSNQILKKGDILICASSGSRNLVGKAASFSGDGEYTFGAFCKVVRPLYFEDADYIAMYFQSPTYRRLISEAAQGININNIRNEHIDALTVKWGSNDMRRQIVERLQMLQIIIQQRHEQLNILDQFIKARFVEMFGTEQEADRWPGCVVADVADVTVGVVIQPTQYYCDYGVPAFRSLNVREMAVNDNDWVYFTEEGQARNQKSIIRENDVLVVRSGAPGVACVATSKYAGYNAVDIIIAHPCMEKVNPVFLAMFTNMPHGMNQIRAKTGGAAQQHYNVGGYKALKLFLPPLDLQNEYAAFVSQVDKSKLSLSQSLQIG